MDFAYFADGVAEILKSEGFEPIVLDGKWCWLSATNRVCLSQPDVLSGFKYTVIRERYETATDGQRYLAARQPNAQFWGSEWDTPQRVAEYIKNELNNPC